ncbi:MAG: zinc dependent phospholipase C family protein [Angelakisella sp.]
MPDFATHFLFGEMLALPQAAQKFPQLFRWGLQGPDPLFYRKVLGGSPYHKLGNRMHEQQTVALFDAMVEFCRSASGQTAQRAEAYLYGFAGHYSLDLTAHPYVYCQQARMAAKTGMDEGIAHCSIENDIDMDLYAQKKGCSACTMDIATLYALPDADAQTVGALYAYLLGTVYQVLLPPEEAAAAFRDTASMQKLIFSGNRLLLGLAGGLEQLIGKKKGGLTGHMKGRQPKWDCMNLDGDEWVSPWTGIASRSSIPEMMTAAVTSFATLSAALERAIAGDTTPLPVAFDFSGRPLQKNL